MLDWETWESFFQKLTQEAGFFILRVLGAVLVLFLGFRLIRFLAKRFERSKLYGRLDPGLASFTASIAKVLLYIGLFLIVLGILGVETASFLALFTSGGVAVALAFQGAVSNLAGGVMILLFHPFRVGDYIETSSIAGTVKEVNVLYTIIVTPDNKRVTVPNGILTNTEITDYSAETTRRIDLMFSVSYRSDVEQIKALLLGVAREQENVLIDPEPQARLQKYGDSALEFVLRVWVKPEAYWDVYYDLNEAVKKCFDENGVEIPFPQLDVHQK